MIFPRRLPAAVASLLSALAAATALAVPLVAPQEPGSPLGEPVASLEGLTLRSESLRLDLRPLAAGREHLVVDAEYRFGNEGATRRLPMIVSTGGARLREEVPPGLWLDDVPAALTPLPTGATPEDWRPPVGTPGLDGAPPLPLALSAWSTDLMAATLDVRPGEHVLRLRYAARPAPDRSRTPTLWQVGYVLAPARRWSAFRLLELEVQLPPGWSTVSDPPLARSSAGLRGTFAAVPADALSLTAQGPMTGAQTPGSPLSASETGRPDPRRRAFKIALTVLLLPGLFIVAAFLALRLATSRRPSGEP
jgi:hypothetical protein